MSFNEQVQLGKIFFVQFQWKEDLMSEKLEPTLAMPKRHTQEKSQLKMTDSMRSNKIYYAL